MESSLSKSKTKIRALLANDHHIVREGIRQLLESAKDIEVIAEAGDGEEAQCLVMSHPSRMGLVRALE